MVGVHASTVEASVVAADVDGAWIVAVTMSEPLVMVSMMLSALTPSRPEARFARYAVSLNVSIVAVTVAVKTTVAVGGGGAGGGGGGGPVVTAAIVM